MDLPSYDLIGEALQRGRVIPFLGAAASLAGRPAGHTWDAKSPYPPTGDELAEHLARRAGFPIEPQRPVELAKVAQFYENVVAGRKLLNEHLSELLKRPFCQGAVHQLLASVPAPLLIVTTNYDELLESAFRKAGKPYDLVIHTTSPRYGERVLYSPHGAQKANEVLPNRLDIDLRARTVIYKMHGSIPSQYVQEDQYVVTEDDYVEFLSRMARGRAIPALFARHFQEQPFLFLGYGLRDWNFRVVLSQLSRQWAQTSSVRSWAIQLNPSPLEKRLWQHRGVEIYSMPVEEFAVRMTNWLERRG